MTDPDVRDRTLDAGSLAFVEIPTPTEIRLRSELLNEQYPAGTENDAKITLLVGDDAPVVSTLTGRKIGPDSQPGVEVPPHLVGTAIRVLALRAERVALGSTSEARTETIGNAGLRSISAGPWSESYFGPTEAANAKALDPDPLIAELLWALCTDEMRDYWNMIWGRGSVPPFARARQFRHGVRQRVTRGY